MGKNTPKNCACTHTIGTKEIGKDKKWYEVKKKYQGTILLGSREKNRSSKKKIAKKAAPKRKARTSSVHSGGELVGEKNQKQFSKILGDFADKVKRDKYTFQKDRFKSDHALIHSAIKRLGKKIYNQLQLAYVGTSINQPFVVQMKNNPGEWSMDEMKDLKEKEGLNSATRAFLKIIFSGKFTRYSQVDKMVHGLNFIEAVKKNGEIFFDGDKLITANFNGVLNVHDFLVTYGKDVIKDKTMIDEMDFS